MKLQAVTPVVKEATAQVVYDHYWMAGMQIQAQDPNGQVNVMARLVPAVDVTDAEGNVTKSLDRGNVMNVRIEDVFTKIAADPTGPLAQAFQAVMVALIAEVPEVEAEE